MTTSAKILFYYSAFLALLLAVVSLLRTGGENQLFQLAFLPVALFFLYHLGKKLVSKNRSDTAVYPEITAKKTAFLLYLVMFFTLGGYGLGAALLSPGLVGPTTNLPDKVPGVNLEVALSPNKLTQKQVVQEDATKDTTIKITANFINVREKPDTNSQVVGTAAQDEVYRVLEADRADGWYKIELDNGKQGWVDYHYVEKVEND